jgi:hypothetical protein
MESTATAAFLKRPNSLLLLRSLAAIITESSPGNQR